MQTCRILCIRILNLFGQKLPHCQQNVPNERDGAYLRITEAEETISYDHIQLQCKVVSSQFEGRKGLSNCNFSAIYLRDMNRFLSDMWNLKLLHSILFFRKKKINANLSYHGQSQFKK